jgi:hypothetical protein
MEVKIGDRLQIAQQNTNLLAALTAPIWCLSPIFNLSATRFPAAVI